MNSGNTFGQSGGAGSLTTQAYQYAKMRNLADDYLFAWTYCGYRFTENELAQKLTTETTQTTHMDTSGGDKLGNGYLRRFKKEGDKGKPMTRRRGGKKLKNKKKARRDAELCDIPKASARLSPGEALYAEPETKCKTAAPGHNDNLVTVSSPTTGVLWLFAAGEYKAKYGFYPGMGPGTAFGEGEPIIPTLKAWSTADCHAVALADMEEAIRVS